MQYKDRANLLGMMDSIAKIEEYLKQISTYEMFLADPKTMDACLIHLVNIGEMTARISEEFQTEITSIDWHKVKGLRNIIAHDYFGIDYREIWSVVSIHIPDLKLKVQKLLE